MHGDPWGGWGDSSLGDWGGLDGDGLCGGASFGGAFESRGDVGGVYSGSVCGERCVAVLDSAGGGGDCGGLDGDLSLRGTEGDDDD